ncbi:MAG TPA: excisionase family DNA-binding protein [Pyrinomonadaceae bacterium]|nr:excisionase family DNA-binding protein [Pyrinomonadaceae bacterium]
MQEEIKASSRLAWGIREAAESIGVSKGHIRNAIAAGELRVSRLGRRVVIPDANLRAWIDRGSSDGDEREAA